MGKFKVLEAGSKAEAEAEFKVHSSPLTASGRLEKASGLTDRRLLCY